MKLKSSNRFPRFFLLGLIGLVLLLVLFNPIKKKQSKYPEAPKIEKTTSLNALQLTFNEKSFKKIKDKRFKALSKGVLETSDEDYVPATVTFQGESYKAEVRLKGDWTDHLVGDKWSFRVKLKGDETILGMRKFSIHHPQTRGFFYTAEWLYLKAIKREGLMGLRYDYVEGSIHVKGKNASNSINKNVGIYALEETFDKRTIESNSGKESVILKFSEDNFWNEVGKSIEVGSSMGYKWGDFMNYDLVSKTKYQILPFSEEKIVLDSTMFKYFRLSRKLLEDVYLNKRPIHEAFDVKKLAMQNAILNLFGAAHGTYIINLRFYYNPITSRLEPIAFDGNSGLKLKKYEHFLFLDKEKDTVYLKELAYALDKVRRPEYLNTLVAQYKDEMAAYEKTLKKEFFSKGFQKANLEYNQEVIKTELLRLKNKLDLNDIVIEADEPVGDIKIPEPSQWVNNKTILSGLPQKFQKQSVYKISRNSTTAPSYSVIANNKVNNGKQYRTSVILKKGDVGSLFGLRVQGDFPNRLDAIFDLANGKVKQTSTGGNFDNINATMKPLGDGWYQCVLSGTIKTSNVKIILGPTSGERQSKNWEGVTSQNGNVYIIPSSLKLEEVSE
ncbi:hypothetical protein [uncultured Psychroserpens sp.]|uniref:phage head spike fiber domain-containing protein n=1 Tax=uncultured Psychroserpens sp. TaxID=255436 RepID=UPI002610FB61|nr:hypothetical protein [uncultured Psychroserpens sp.]